MRWPLWRVAVAERSMEPVLRPGDWLLVRRRLRAGRPLRIRTGQLVIARHPGRPGLLLVKRAGRREPAGWWLQSDNPGAGAVDSLRRCARPADGGPGDAAVLAAAAPRPLTPGRPVGPGR